MLAALKHVVGLPELIAKGIYDGVDEDTVAAVLAEAGKFATEVLDPLNRVGDQIGSTIKNEEA